MRQSTIMILGITTLLLVGLFLWLDQKPQQIPTETAFAWEITRDEVRGPETVQVLQGQHVTLNILADFNDEVHLHGYELRQALVPMKWQRITFVAEHSGRFILELHQRDAVLGAVQIMPR